MSRKVLFDWFFVSSRFTKSSVECGRSWWKLWSAVRGAMAGNHGIGWSSRDRVAVS